MAKIYRRKRRYPIRRRRRRYRRRRWYGGRPSTRNLTMRTIPDRLMMTFKYTDRLSLTTAGVYKFCLNGLFDPDLTSTGHQPYLFDQMMLLYARYKVYVSKIVLQACNDTGDNVGLALVPTGVATSTFADAVSAKEVPYAKFAIVGPASAGPRRMYHSMSVKKIRGVPSLSDDEFHGNDSANPVITPAWNIVHQNLDNPGTAYELNLAVTIYYKAIISRRLLLSPS